MTAHGWAGEVRPMHGGATVVVFARDPAVVQQVAELLANGVRWRHGGEPSGRTIDLRRHDAVVDDILSAPPLLHCCGIELERED